MIYGDLEKFREQETLLLLDLSKDFLLSDFKGVVCNFFYTRDKLPLFPPAHPDVCMLCELPFKGKRGRSFSAGGVANFRAGKM